MGQYHTRQRRGDQMMEEVMWSVVGWGPRRRGWRRGSGMRSEDHRVRRLFEAVLGTNFHWMEMTNLCDLCDLASSRTKKRYQGTT